MLDTYDSNPSMLGSLSSCLSFVCVELDICNTSLLADLLLVAPGLMVHLTAFSGSASKPAPGETLSDSLRVTYCITLSGWMGLLSHAGLH